MPIQIAVRTRTERTRMKSASYAAMVEDPAFHLGDPIRCTSTYAGRTPLHFRADVGMWLVTRYYDVVQISKDNEPR